MIFLLALNIAAAFVIFINGLYAINHMSADTTHRIRIAWIAMTTGALAILAGPLFGYMHPAWQEVMLNIGCACYVQLDRSNLLEG